MNQKQWRKLLEYNKRPSRLYGKYFYFTFVSSITYRGRMKGRKTSGSVSKNESSRSGDVEKRSKRFKLRREYETLRRRSSVCHTSFVAGTDGSEAPTEAIPAGGSSHRRQHGHRRPRPRAKTRRALHASRGVCARKIENCFFRFVRDHPHPR